MALAREFEVVGFDTDASRIDELSNGIDRNAMYSTSDLMTSSLRFTGESDALGQANFIIVAVPTPVDGANHPELTALREACRTVGSRLRRGGVVVIESTVYPGCTEEVCVPILERESGLVVNRDFGVGYSPERIDPGDPRRTLGSVVKVVAAGDEETCEALVEVYGRIVAAGLHVAPDIRTAEAAKLIENVQRDLNIALMNELSILFHKLGLDTQEVFAAATTKWNFLPFYPGLVGGHCIPVDPYYLVHKADSIGHKSEVILAGRHINDTMASYVATEAVKLLSATGKEPAQCRALVLGLTFKEDVRDSRNAQSVRLVHELERMDIDVWVSDPLTRVEELADRTIDDPFAGGEPFDLVVLAVPHKGYKDVDYEAYLRLFGDEPGGVLVDVRGMLTAKWFEDNGVTYWRL